MNKLVLVVDILRDEELQSACNKFISAMLPHENYDGTFFMSNLQALFKYIHFDEMTMEYRVLVSVLVQLGDIKEVFPNFIPKLDRKSFEDVVMSSIGDAIVSPELGVREWLEYEGQNNNLSIETVREAACNKVYTRSMELYDVCWDLAQPSETAINQLPSLRAAFLAHVSMQSIETQVTIIKAQKRIGKKVWAGQEDWLLYYSQSCTEIQNRLQNAEDDSVLTLDTISKSDELLRGLSVFFTPIANYGIPALDGDETTPGTPILRHRFVVVVGAENIGKTMFAVDTAVNVLMAGGKVAFMCGESQKAMIYSSIMMNYIHKKFGVFVMAPHLAGLMECPEYVQKFIGIAKAELVASGNLTLVDSFSYETVYDELVSLYDQVKFDFLAIDHSCALAGSYGSGSVKDSVDHLASCVKTFRKKYPVCVMVTSHPSTMAKEQLAKNKDIEGSPTKGSQNLSTDADEVFVLRDNEALRKAGLIELENTKRRNVARLTYRIVLKKQFAVCRFIYDETAQRAAEAISATAEDILDSVQEEDDDDYDL